MTRIIGPHDRNHPSHMTLYRGVYPIPFDATDIDRRALNRSAVAELQTRHILNEGNLVIITKGDLIGVHGRTNSMKIVTVGDLPDHTNNHAN